MQEEKFSTSNTILFFLPPLILGDITQKGYEKKRTRLLQPYAQKNAQKGNYIYERTFRDIVLFSKV